MKFKSLCIFSCILILLIILIKPYTTKAHERRASGDCGTSGYIIPQCFIRKDFQQNSVKGTAFFNISLDINNDTVIVSIKSIDMM